MPWIAVVQDTPFRWGRLITPRTGPFIRAFTDEASRCQIRLQPVVESPGDATARGIDLSVEELVYRARKDPGYRGAVITGTAEQYRDFRETVRQVAGIGQPTVWLDLRSRGETVDFGTRHAIHARFSERLIAEEAIRFLGDWGHRVAAYVSYTDTGWQPERGALLREAGERASPKIRILSYSEVYRQFAGIGMEGVANRVASLHRDAPPTVKRLLGFCLNRLAPWASTRGLTTAGALAAFLMDWPAMEQKFPPELSNLREHVCFLMADEVFELGPPSAFIGPSDSATRGEFRVLTSAGVSVPDDFSYISFDNYLDPVTLPVSTVDIGAGWLGYASFHTILGDVPIRPRRRDNDLVARPRVDRRGSVGVPAG
jgi:DNA-binding LacI/PurR family transcriptional regulator